jgi:hypothetical protein
MSGIQCEFSKPNNIMTARAVALYGCIAAITEVGNGLYFAHLSCKDIRK